MRVVVTGSSGMIGTAFCERAAALGHDLIPIDRQRNRWNAEIDTDTRLIDLLNAPGTYDLPASGVDIVVHCAANARVHDLVVRPEGAIENIVTCGHALEYARRTGAAFVFTSSREVYGNRGLAKYREEDASLDRIESPYAASKLAGEALVQSYWRVYEIPATIVRLSNVYGRYDLSDRFIPIAVRAAMSGSTLTIYGKEKRLDFTYLDDVIDGLVRVVEGSRGGEADVFNLATGSAISLIEAAELVAQGVERDIQLKLESTRPGEVVDYEADISKARRLLDYRPKYTLRSALPMALDWYRSQGAAR